MAIGEVLVALRKSRGLSQERLAQILCEASGHATLTRSDISRWERGFRVPGRFWLPWLAEAFNVTLDQLERAKAVSDPPPGYVPAEVSHPVFIEGRRVALPIDMATVAGRGLLNATVQAQALDARETSHAAPPSERAQELYVRSHSLLPTNDKDSVAAARTLLDSVVAMEPGYARARADRGYATWRQYFAGWTSDAAALDAALGDIDAALRMEPDSIAGHMSLIRLCWDVGWHERALELGRSIHYAHPESLDASLCFARALNNAGMADLAVPLTRQVLAIDPGYPAARKLLIWNLVMAGHPRPAVEAASTYLAANRGDSNTRWAVAIAHLESGDVRRAIDTAADATAANPSDITGWTLLGYLHRVRGSETAARLAWASGVDHCDVALDGGNNRRTQAWLANIYACLSQRDEVYRRVDTLRDAEQHNGYIKYRLAHAVAELGDADVAVHLLHEASQDGFLSIQLLEHEEKFGTAALTRSPAYRHAVRELSRNVARIKRLYTAPNHVREFAS